MTCTQERQPVYAVSRRLGGPLRDFATFDKDSPLHSELAQESVLLRPLTAEELTQVVGTRDPNQRGGAWLRPLVLSKEGAEQVRRFLADTSGQDWVLEEARHPCPSCGQFAWPGDLDSVHRNTHRTAALEKSWVAGCWEHNFGCGFFVEGASEADVVQRWNQPQQPSPVGEAA